MNASTRDTAARSSESHRNAMGLTPKDLVVALKDKLGTRLAAFIADKDPSTINRWSTGETEPSEEALRPLRAAYQVFDLLEREESDHTIRAWFMGMNPQLEDVSPAEALQEGQLREVLAAARAFHSGG